MKRQRDEATVEYTLTTVPLEVALHIFSFLDLHSLHSALRCMLSALHYFPGKPSRVINNDAVAFYEGCNRLLEHCHAPTHTECLRQQYLASTDEKRVALVSLLSAREAARALEATRAVVNNRLFPAQFFLTTEMCAHCRRAMGVWCCWKATRPLPLCVDCYRVLLARANNWAVAPAFKDNFSWTSTGQMKELCGLRKQERAQEWADRNRIRRYSLMQTGCASVKKDLYFYQDVIEYLSQ